MLWEKTWGGEGYEQALSVVPANDGGYFIFGETDSHGAGDRDFFLLKITEDGSEEWFQTYGKANREWPFGMLQLKNGDFLLYGFTESMDEGGRNQYALRVGGDGYVIWEYSSGAPEEELILDALETSDGDLILGGGDRPGWNACQIGCGRECYLGESLPPSRMAVCLPGCRD